MKNISISLDEEMIHLLEDILRRDKTKRSRSAIISESLYEYISIHFPALLKQEKSDLGPSLIPQLKTRKKILKAPSFRFMRKLHITLEPWIEYE